MRWHLAADNNDNINNAVFCKKQIESDSEQEICALYNRMSHMYACVCVFVRWHYLVLPNIRINNDEKNNSTASAIRAI